MTASSPATEPVAVPDAEPDDGAEIERLRLRVAAQDRLIEAILAENDDIHALRRRNHQLEQYLGKLLGSAPAQAVLKVRRRVLRRPEPE